MSRGGLGTLLRHRNWMGESRCLAGVMKRHRTGLGRRFAKFSVALPSVLPVPVLSPVSCTGHSIHFALLDRIKAEHPHGSILHERHIHSS